jgi:signal transduction histidine kinase
MISKLEVGDLDLDISEFDIVELIENVFELLEMKAEKKKLRFRLRTTTYCLICREETKIEFSKSSKI